MPSASPRGLQRGRLYLKCCSPLPSPPVNERGKDTPWHTSSNQCWLTWPMRGALARLQAAAQPREAAILPLEVWGQLQALGMKTPPPKAHTLLPTGQRLPNPEQAVLLPPPSSNPFSSSLCPGDEVQTPSKTHEACTLPPSLSHLLPAHQPYPQPPLLRLAEKKGLPHASSALATPRFT